MNLEHYPEELEGLFAKISDMLVERGVDSRTADEAAFRVTEFMRDEWGGRSIKFRKPKVRDEEPGTWNQDNLLPVPDPPSPVPDPRGHHALLLRRAVTILAGLGLAEAHGVAVADMVRDDWSGQAIYVNNGLSYDLARRDYAIWREWDGSYAKKMELIRRHRISEVWFYKIIEKARKREFRRTQPGLPFGSAQG